MPAKDIKDLRKAGRLEEALTMAKSEMEADPGNIWPKRNISWVYYDYLKQYTDTGHADIFLTVLKQIKDLGLPADETILFENIAWQTGKMIFQGMKDQQAFSAKPLLIWNEIRDLAFPKPGTSYSFLFKAFHKAFKEGEHYTEFADWWGLDNFLAEDYEKEKLPNGRDIMSIAEQGFITYAKHLLPKYNSTGTIIFRREKAEAFIPKLESISLAHPRFQYPAYFQAKLLLALGERNNLLSSLLPFAKKKQNDFWVWEILAEAFHEDPEKVYQCYCRALCCNAPEEMLVGLRQKMSAIFIGRGMLPEAKHEILQIIKTRNANGWKIPSEILTWQSQSWFGSVKAAISNEAIYKSQVRVANSFLFSDIPQENIIVEFVNKDKKVLNFIASENRFGFFKYDSLIKSPSVGDVMRVRFRDGMNGGVFHVVTAEPIQDDVFRTQYFRIVEGPVMIREGQSFGFLNDVFIHPSLVSKFELCNGKIFRGSAIKTFNKAKNSWGWKLIE